jgi:hypothetical protein
MWWSSLELWRPGLHHWTNYTSVMKFSICNEWHFVINLHMVLSPSDCTCGTYSYSSVTLAICHKVSTRSFLHLTCTCGILLHLTCTYGTYSCSSVMHAIRHKSLCLVLSPSDMYLWDPSTSDLWDLTAYVSRVPMGPFSISIRPMGPNGCVSLDACNSS